MQLEAVKFQILAGKKSLHPFKQIYLVYWTDGVLSDRPNVDGRETRFDLMVYLTFKYNDTITCMCLTYHLRSHVNQRPKCKYIAKGSKLGCTLRQGKKIVTT